MYSQKILAIRDCTGIEAGAIYRIVDRAARHWMRNSDALRAGAYSGVVETLVLAGAGHGIVVGAVEERAYRLIEEGE